MIWYVYLYMPFFVVKFKRKKRLSALKRLDQVCACGWLCTYQNNVASITRSVRSVQHDPKIWINLQMRRSENLLSLMVADCNMLITLSFYFSVSEVTVRLRVLIKLRLKSRSLDKNQSFDGNQSHPKDAVTSCHCLWPPNFVTAFPFLCAFHGCCCSGWKETWSRVIYIGPTKSNIVALENA